MALDHFIQVYKYSLVFYPNLKLVACVYRNSKGIIKFVGLPSVNKFCEFLEHYFDINQSTSTQQVSSTLRLDSQASRAV